MKRLHTFAAIATLVLLSASVAHAQKMKSMPPTSKAHLSKADKDAMKAAHNAATDERKADERAENTAKAALKDQPKDLLKDVKLTKEEKESAKAIEKKTSEQIEVLEKQEQADEKAGRRMDDVAHKINELREQERTELRAALTPEHQAHFDANVARMKDKH
jgi:hypothetical protein